MKKMIKKIAAAFMAFALVAAGMLAVNKAEVKAAAATMVTVVVQGEGAEALASADNDNLYFYAWDGGYATGDWGDAPKMTNNGDRTWKIENLVCTGAMNVIIKNASGQTTNITNVAVDKAVVTITMANSKDGENKYNSNTVNYGNEAAEVVEEAYYVTGNKELCGGEGWQFRESNNKMTNDNGVWSITYDDVPVGNHSFKITNHIGTWSNSWGNNGQNYNFGVASVCDVTITFNESTKAITVNGDGLGTPPLDVEKIIIAGTTNLCGSDYDETDDNNKMTANGNVYTKTYTGLAAGTYAFKFAANGAWDDSWGGAFSASGAETSAAYGGYDNNISFTTSYTQSSVTIKLDLTDFDYGTKNGAKFTVTIVDTTPADDDDDDSTTPSSPAGDDDDDTTTPSKPAVGSTWIIAGDKADLFGTEWDPKNDDNAMSDTDGDGVYTKVYKGVAADTYSFKVTNGTWDVAYGTGKDNYTLVVKTACDVTISFDTATNTVSATGSGVSLDGPDLKETYYIRGVKGWTVETAELMTDNGDGTYSKTYTNVEKSFSFKVAQDVPNAPNDGWYKSWGAPAAGQGDDNNDNMTAKVSAKSDVTIKFTPAKDKVEITVIPVQDEDDDTTTPSSPADDEEDTNTYYVAGDEGLCGTKWDPSKNQMVKNEDGTWSIKFTNVNAGKYEFKIATNGDWNNGEYNLEGDASNKGPNAVIEVKEDGSTVIITFDGTKAIITMNDVPAGGGEDTPAGDSSMVAIFAILAVLAAGVVTVAVAKRRAIEE